MPDFGHVAVGLWGARLYAGEDAPRAEFWRTGAAFSALSLLPDVDMIGRALGYDGTMLGHRGLTHSLAFAGAVALAALWLRGRRWALYALAIVASHGALDMLDVGPNGVAYLWPLSAKTYFWPDALRFLPGPPPGENYWSWAGAHRVAAGAVWFVPFFHLALRPRLRSP